MVIAETVEDLKIKRDEFGRFSIRMGISIYLDKTKITSNSYIASMSVKIGNSTLKVVFECILLYEHTA